MSMRTLVILSVVVLGAAALAIAGLGPWREGPPIAVVPVRSGTIRAYVEELGKTRLPSTHVIAMPYEGRIEPIRLEAGDRVEAGQVVARIVPEDLEHRVAAARAAVDRLDAAIREARDASVEEAIIEQVHTFLETVARTVEAAGEQVKAGQARLDFANANLRRKQVLNRRDAATEEELDRAKAEQVEAAVAYQQGVLLASAIRSMQAAVSMTPEIVQCTLHCSLAAYGTGTLYRPRSIIGLSVSQQSSIASTMK